ncbi:hypothetical protein G7Y89_g2250 [Cudoniella acicularis]|uniref:Major facilitator superfamily (MFS) profile domain-containing protein n=1 Tax=Cudoniella acicularis TaxID=354080 RepID=A0A8H4RVG0_9HELO|nr:hypothetical protein G7Y89_g2250 [Cudoniella acicularis]
MSAAVQRRMLSKEDEATAAGDEVEVRREDQDKINRFSRLHQREIAIEEELKSKHKEKEDLDDISNELELADEDDKIPYKIGDGFISLPLTEVQERLSASTDRIEEEVTALEEKLTEIREEQTQLKVELYARFGRSINLETRGVVELPDFALIILKWEFAPTESPGQVVEWWGKCMIYIGMIMVPSSKSTVAAKGRESSDAGLVEKPQPTQTRNGLMKIISGIDQSDAEQKYQIEAEDNKISSIPVSSNTSVTSPSRIIISWKDGDVENPYNWSSIKKAWVVFIGMLLTGVNASSPIACIGGVYADMYGDPVTRGRAMAVFIGGTCIGPLVAPVISGYISPVKGWRWTFWVGLIVAGATLPPLFSLPETYGPILLAKRAAKLRKTTNNPNIFAPIELEKKGWKQMATVTLTRPLRMLAFELIVLATCLYLSLAYGIFYMYFEAYPIIFEGIYGQTPGVSGLMFLPIGGGTVSAIALFLWYDAFLRKAQKQGKAWTQKEESRRLPLACVGGPLYVISLFWLGWTARPSIPFYVPMLAGLPFGMGFILIFMALLNYLTDAYEIFAASSMAAASCCRSVAGAVLPFAATPMYRKLGVPWASSLLAFLSLGMCIIPFTFLWKGDTIRANSKFCNYLREKKEKELAELERQRRDNRTIEGLGSKETVEEKLQIEATQLPFNSITITNPLISPYTMASKTIVLISGGNTGIGYEIVKRLSTTHPTTHHILMGTRSLQNGQKALTSLSSPPNVTPVQLDITSDSSIDTLFQTIKSQYGKLDVLINNAATAGLDLGEAKPGTFHPEGKSLRELYTHVYATNTVGTAVLTDNMIPLLSLSPKPKIIFVSSGLGSIGRLASGEMGIVECPWYSSSKAAVNYLMVFYARKLGESADGKKWAVNAACPGLNATGLNHVPLSEETDPKNGAVRPLDLLSHSQPKTQNRDWLHRITHWPERLPGDDRFALEPKVLVRLVLDAGTRAFGFQIDNEIDSKTILEHFKQRFINSHEYTNWYEDLVRLVLGHAFTSVSNTIHHPNLRLKMYITGPKHWREEHYYNEFECSGRAALEELDIQEGKNNIVLDLGGATANPYISTGAPNAEDQLLSRTWAENISNIMIDHEFKKVLDSQPDFPRDFLPSLSNSHMWKLQTDKEVFWNYLQKLLWFLIDGLDACPHVQFAPFGEPWAHPSSPRRNARV